MQVQVLSDVHIEFQKDLGIKFAKGLDTAGSDVLIVAGDLCSGNPVLEEAQYYFLRTVAEKTPHVLYIIGNHEPYHSSIEEAHARARRIESQVPNLTFLEDEVAVIDGQRFVGCTLWFEEQFENYRWEMNLGDFHYIEDIRGEFNVYDRSARSQKFLDGEVKKGDVVITHHMPHPKSLHPKYKGSPLNRFFLCDVSDVMVARKPALWIHGHTHFGMEYKVGSTRVVCNPYGYEGYEFDNGYHAKKTIEV